MAGDTNAKDSSSSHADAGHGVGDLLDEISRLHGMLDGLGTPPLPLAEVVDSTNTLRTNEYLATRDNILTRLVGCYSQYAARMDSVTRGILDVQSELLGVLKAQSEMIDAPQGGGRRARGTSLESGGVSATAGKGRKETRRRSTARRGTAAATTTGKKTASKRRRV